MAYINYGKDTTSGIIGGIVGQQTFYSSETAIKKCICCLDSLSIMFPPNGYILGGVIGQIVYRTSSGIIASQCFYKGSHFKNVAVGDDGSSGQAIIKARNIYDYEFLDGSIVKEIGLPFIMEMCMKQRPMLSWEKASGFGGNNSDFNILYLNEIWMNYKNNIWTDYCGGNKKINLYFQNQYGYATYSSSDSRKYKKLDISIFRKNINQISSATDGELIYKKTIYNPSVLEKIEFDNIKSILNYTDDYQIYKVPSFLHIKVVWTTLNGRVCVEERNFYPYDLYNVKIRSTYEANNYISNLDGAQPNYIQEGKNLEEFTSSFAPTGIHYPIEYYYSMSGGGYNYFYILTCTGEIVDEGTTFPQFVSEDNQARRAVVGYAMKKNISALSVDWNSSYIIESGTLGFSQRKYWVVWSNYPNPIVVLSDGTILEGYEMYDESGGGGGGVACFLEGTKILTSNGLKNIESISEGDFVLSKNEKTGDVEEQKVYHTYHHDPKYCFNIKLDNGEELNVTHKHPIYIKNKGEVEARHLVVGDILINKDNKEISIVEINKNNKIDKPVYEIWVENNRNYFVGDSSILVYSEREVVG